MRVMAGGPLLPTAGASTTARWVATRRTWHRSTASASGWLFGSGMGVLLRKEASGGQDTGCEAKVVNLEAPVVVGLLSLTATVLFFALNRHRDRQIHQAELLRNYTVDFYGDARILSVFAEIDADRYTISESDVATPKEWELIRLLDFLNILGANWHRGVVSLRDVAPTTLGYAAVRVHANPTVIEYLEVLARSDSVRYPPGTAFGYFRELAAALSTYPLLPLDSPLPARLRVALQRLGHRHSAAFRVRDLPRPLSNTIADVRNPDNDANH